MEICLALPIKKSWQRLYNIRYTKPQFDIYPESFIKVDEVTSGQDSQRYAFKSNYKTNKCKCKASGILLNSKCHRSLLC
ncbi:Uncharacterized protein FWK35_00016732 [Aphis craccivora]|uniref:Uncharacterized protein n=1 Tax=Aphis craccivora TaxID=307492 RepID=A0A6G0YVG9_APHCR|nr:Uncharacterized protein FWK35_00016732 [Aphis craccivora]